MNGNNQAFNADAGLTIREYIATQAMAALITTHEGINAHEADWLASDAVKIADALIAKLSK